MDDRNQQGVLNVKSAVKSPRLLLLGFACLQATSLAFGQAPAGNRPVPRPAAPAAAPAARPAAAQAAGHVAVVDVGYIFKNHTGFNSQMELMKTEVQKYEEQLRARHQELSQEREQLLQFKPGTPNYDKLEREMADKAAKLQVDTQLKKKEFLTREAKVYFDVYNEVSKSIEEFANMNNIDLVLRYNGDDIDSEDRQSVLTGVNRAIVYHRNLDITREVLDRLNRAPRVSQNPAAGGAPAKRPVRQ
jgi:Skp family chaperone for outer membrane proteins